MAIRRRLETEVVPSDIGAGALVHVPTEQAGHRDRVASASLVLCLSYRERYSRVVGHMTSHVINAATLLSLSAE